MISAASVEPLAGAPVAYAATPPAAPLGRVTARVQFFAHVTTTSQRGLAKMPPVEVRWRLLSGNHRCLGVGPAPFPTLAEARAAAEGLRDRCDDATIRIAHGGACEWTWTLTLDGVVVAASGRGYQRRIECDLSARQFLIGVRVAAMGPDVVRFGLGRSGSLR